MLNHLHIRNLAVVDEVEVELGNGMTTLTGETGAGKSILIDALSLALGDRADSQAVRPGARRAEVAATFEIAADSPAARWLGENDLEEDNACTVRRVVTAEGRSRGYINGNTVPMQTLRELGELLVDICGQQAHQALAKPDNQRRLLDQYGGTGLLKTLAQVRQTHAEWRDWQERFDALHEARADQANRIDLLSFQVQELTALDAQPGEFAELEAAHKRAANASKLLEGAGAALQLLYDNDDGSAHAMLTRSKAALEDLAELDESLAELAGLLSEAEIQVSETADALRHYVDQDDHGSASLGELETRLSAMLDLARKHKVNAAELPELTEKLTEELHAIEHADDTLDDLRANVATSEAELLKACKKLTRARKQAATKLATAVTAHMRELGMPDGTFAAALRPVDTPGTTGAERVEFVVSINPGMQPGALNKVASGGELSRVSLAIQVAASNSSNTPTLIFDEVDAGVGGGTADIVGAKLRSLAADNQVLCVTHLPQVASKGHAQLRVAKLSDGENTRTSVAELSAAERVDELARMLGGQEITQATRDHAAEMLSKAG